jgi:hypothetical protein
MADCIAAETARATHRPLATADPDLLDVCLAERIEIIPLPGSDGRLGPRLLISRNRRAPARR